MEDIARSFRFALLIPTLPSIASFHRTVLVELDSMFLRLWVGRVSHERYTLVNFENGAVKRGWSADIEVEDFWAGLIPDQKQVLESARNEQRMLVSCTLEKGICSNRRRESNIVCDGSI